MAKADSLITIRGTRGGIMFVKSRTYGDRVRAELEVGGHWITKLKCPPGGGLG